MKSFEKLASGLEQRKKLTHIFSLSLSPTPSLSHTLTRTHIRTHALTRARSETGSRFSWNVMFVCEKEKPLRLLPPTLFTSEIEKPR